MIMRLKVWFLYPVFRVYLPLCRKYVDPVYIGTNKLRGQMKLITSCEGQAVTEYGLILALISVIVLTALLALQENVIGVLEKVSDGVTSAVPQ